jgi:hypothetical protein
MNDDITPKQLAQRIVAYFYVPRDRLLTKVYTHWQDAGHPIKDLETLTGMTRQNIHLIASKYITSKQEEDNEQA